MVNLDAQTIKTTQKNHAINCLCHSRPLYRGEELIFGGEMSDRMELKTDDHWVKLRENILMDGWETH